MMETYFLFVRILYFSLSQKVKSKSKIAKILPINQTNSSHLALMCSGNAARDEQGHKV